MIKLRLPSVLFAALLLGGACGKSKPATTADGGGGSGGGDAATDGGNVINVMVSGTAMPHPLTRMMDPTADFSMLQVAVIDPMQEILGRPPLATMALDTSPANCGAGAGGSGGTGGSSGDASASDGGASDAPRADGAASDAPIAAVTDGGPFPDATTTADATAVTDAARDVVATGDGGTATGGTNGPCGWSFPAVNIAGITLGLVAKSEDNRAAANRLWLKTGTGNGTAAFIAMEKTSKAPITGRQVFAVSRVTADKLAMLAAAALGGDGGALTGTELETRGFMIGHVVGKQSQGAPPIAGATVVTAAADKLDIVYPNATFTGASTSGGTAAHGIFLVVPKAAATPAAVVTNWMVTAPSGETRTWDTYTAGTSPGSVFVILLLAKE